jgi:hypothetical protein
MLFAHWIHCAIFVHRLFTTVAVLTVLLMSSMSCIRRILREGQGHHAPVPGAGEVYKNGALLHCNEGITVTVGPVIGEVTHTTVVCLLEISIAAHLGSQHAVTAHVSLVDEHNPRGKVVASATLQLHHARASAFYFTSLRPDKQYYVTFNGVSAADAQQRTGSFATRSLQQSSVNIIAVCDDCPEALLAGEPTLWCTLQQRLQQKQQQQRVDAVLHLGGQVSMQHAFEEALQLLWQSRVDKSSTADEHHEQWSHAVAAATERLRCVYRRAWSEQHKQRALANVSNLMLGAEADVHGDVWHSAKRSALLQRLQSSSTKRNAADKQEVLQTLIRAARTVFHEYQGQLLWPSKPTASSSNESTAVAAIAAVLPEASEAMFADAAAAQRLCTAKALRLKAAQTAFAQAQQQHQQQQQQQNGSGSDDTGTADTEQDSATAAAMERVDTARAELAAAESSLEAVSSALQAAAQSHSIDYTAFRWLHPATAVILLDTLWSSVAFDGSISDSTQCVRDTALHAIEAELRKDSELRLVVLACSKPIVGGYSSSATGNTDPWAALVANAADSSTDATAITIGSVNGDDNDTQKAVCVQERTRLLQLLLQWKAGEAWREVVLLCGRGASSIGSGCELHISSVSSDSSTADTPETAATAAAATTIFRQLMPGPITAAPLSSSVECCNGTVDSCISYTLASADNTDTQQSSSGTVTSTSTSTALQSLHNQRSYLTLACDAGASPEQLRRTNGSAAVDAQPCGVSPTITAQLTGVFKADARVVVGPVIGRVTQCTAVVLLEVNCTAAVVCVLQDAVTGAVHKQARALRSSRAYAFHFTALAPHTCYTVVIEGVSNAEVRRGCFTTLPLWLGLRVPRILQQPQASTGTAGATATTTASSKKAALRDTADACVDLRLLFASGSGACDSDTVNAQVLALELSKPWPQCDIVVHTGGQIALAQACTAAIALLAQAEQPRTSATQRAQLEAAAADAVRDAYRHQWSLPGMRAFLSSGSHLMARGVHDMGLQSLLEQPTTTQQQQQQQQQLSPYVRSALHSWVLQAYCEYQRQLWCPATAVAGSELDDFGYCSGGAAVDSAAPTRAEHSNSNSSASSSSVSLRDNGQWHFHTYGDAVGLFMLDVHHSSSSAGGAMRTQASAPMLCSKQWASISAVLQLPQLRVLCLVSALPFATVSLRCAVQSTSLFSVTSAVPVGVSCRGMCVRIA